MRESIVCIGRTGSKPYCFSETGVCISSYEELCYYLRGHMLCYLYTLPEEELLTYLRDELGLYKLYHQLIKFTDPVRDQMKYFSTLFREGNYFSEEEIHQILDEYRYLKNLPYALQCKMTGDMYLQAGRAAMAIYYYKEALKGEALTAAETGAVDSQSKTFPYPRSRKRFCPCLPLQWGGGIFILLLLPDCTHRKPGKGGKRTGNL